MEKFDNLVTLLVVIIMVTAILPAWLKGCAVLINLMF
jgi:hypothetical protein